jgi:DNA-binding response OmpR family regulator
VAIPSLRSDPPKLNGQSILVVDDEPGIRDLVCDYLGRDGFRVSQAVSGLEALSKLKAEDTSLVILDVALPEMDGFSVLAELRKHSDLPVILLTGRAEESDRVLGLELGADDYVLKPFSPRELVARVRNLLKRHHRVDGANGRLEFGDLVVDTMTREVTREGEPVDLTPKEFELLEFLCTSPRQVFSKERLLGQVWNSAPERQDPDTVTVHVRRLRQKIGDDPKDPRWIITVWGVGYRFEP